MKDKVSLGRGGSYSPQTYSRLPFQKTHMRSLKDLACARVFLLLKGREVHAAGKQMITLAGSARPGLSLRLTCFLRSVDDCKVNFWLAGMSLCAIRTSQVP